MTGKFVQEWQNVLKDSGADVKEVDVALGVSSLLAVKDTEELVRPDEIPTLLEVSNADFVVPRDLVAKRAQCSRHDEQAHESFQRCHVKVHRRREEGYA